MKELALKYIKHYWLYALILAYVYGNIYVLTYKRFYYYPYNLLPVILFILYTAIFHLQRLVFFLAFCTPLAISLKEMGLTQGPDLSIPTEPLMAGIMLLYIIHSISQPINAKKFLNHPISWLIYAQLFWMFCTMLNSTDIIVSLKYLVSRLWFIFSCYIIIPHLFQHKKNILTFVYAYSAALTIVVIYTSVRHSAYNFSAKSADWVVSPFYNDHTAYGAALAIFIPVLVAMLFMKSVSYWAKLIVGGLFVLFLVALIISYCRAGWLSLALAIAVLATLWLKIKFRTLLAGILVFGGLFLLFRVEIMMVLDRNNTDSEGGFENNIASVSNISTDASNVERLNRWSCAYRMWLDKPLMGWGPGTYMFKYAPYQLSYEKSYISTNFGTNGNAHSEYLGPLAEQGLPGLLIVLSLLITTCFVGYRLIYTLEDTDSRLLCTGIFLGLITYYVHGFFNNFLDTDKLSLPFWAFMAALVCFDVFQNKKTKTNL